MVKKFQKLKLSKVTVQGKREGYHYLSYLHDFIEGYYLLNCLRKGSQIRLKTHWIGNSDAYFTGEKHGWRHSFNLSSFNDGFETSQHCDNTRYSDEGSILSSVGSWGSNSQRQVNSWLTSTFYRYNEERMMYREETTSRDVSVGELLTKSNKLSINDLFPKSKKELSLAEDLSGYCAVSDQPGIGSEEGCARLAKMKDQIDTQGSRYYKMMNRF